MPTATLLLERSVITAAYKRALNASDERACAAACRILDVLVGELAHRGCDD